LVLGVIVWSHQEALRELGAQLEVITSANLDGSFAIPIKWKVNWSWTRM